MLRITKSFEQSFVATLATDPQTYGLFISHIDPDDFALEQSRAIVKGLVSYWKKYCKPVKDLTTLEQWLKSESNRGEIDLDKVYSAKEFIISGRTEDIEGVKTQAAEAIRTRKKQQVAEELVMNMDDDHALNDAVSSLDKIEKIGVEKKSEALSLGDSMFDEIANLGRKFRCPTSIPDLDVKMRGGMAKGELLIFCASSGGGKSLALISMAAGAIKRGFNVAFATLELASAYQGMRLLASLTGVETNKIESSQGLAEAKARFQQLKDTSGLGDLHIQEFEPTLGTSQDVIEWVRGLEDEHGKEIDLVVIDYLDKLGTTKISRPNAGSYEIQGQAAEDLRYYAMEGNKKWVATASQSKGREKKTTLGMSDIADSIAKARVCDVMVTINKDKDTDQISLFIAKSRGGVCDILVGPYAPGFEYGSLLECQVGFPELRAAEVKSKQVRF